VDGKKESAVATPKKKGSRMGESLHRTKLFTDKKNQSAPRIKKPRPFGAAKGKGARVRRKDLHSRAIIFEVKRK